MKQNTRSKHHFLLFSVHVISRSRAHAVQYACACSDRACTVCPATDQSTSQYNQENTREGVTTFHGARHTHHSEAPRDYRGFHVGDARLGGVRIFDVRVKIQHDAQWSIFMRASIF